MSGEPIFPLLRLGEKLLGRMHIAHPLIFSSLSVQWEDPQAAAEGTPVLRLATATQGRPAARSWLEWLGRSLWSARSRES